MQKTVENGESGYDRFLQEQLRNKQQVERDRQALSRLGKLGGYRKRERQDEEEEMLVQVTSYCFKCGEDVVMDPETRELVCVKCGRVWGVLPDPDSIPFSESGVEGGHSEGNYSPTGHMDYGNGLGSKNDRGVNADVLGGRTDPLSWNRSNNVRITLAHPFILKFLSFGSQFCNKYDLHQKYNNAHLAFADQLAVNLRLVAEHYVMGKRKLRADPWRASASLFCLLFREHYPEKYNSIKAGSQNEKQFPELFLPDSTLRYFGLILMSCHPPVLPVLP